MSDFSVTNNSNCDVSTIFAAGSGPSDGGANVSINGTPLIPSPFVNLSVEKYNVGNLSIGGVLRLTLNGTVTGNSFNDVVIGEAGVRTGLNNILEIGQKGDCVHVQINCADTLINGHGRIISISSDEGNQPTWVNMAPYSIEIELYTNDIEGLPEAEDRIVIPDKIVASNPDLLKDLMLKSISETFSIDIGEETFNWGNIKCSGVVPIDGFGNRHIKANFSISAGGINGCNGDYQPTGYKFGLEAAEQYIINRLNDLHNPSSNNLFTLSDYYDSPNSELTTALSDYIGGSAYLDLRNLSINSLEASIEISGNIIYRPSGCQNPEVFTTLNVENQLNVDGENITITGNIIGLIDNNYNKIINDNLDSFNECDLKTKITNAETFLDKIKDTTLLKDIAECYKDPKGYIQDDCPLSASSSGNYSGICGSGEETQQNSEDLCPDMRLISSQINRNISEGEISFSFTLSNTANCDITGATKVTVEVTHDKPHDNIVEHLIPGRGSKGVLIQNLCCVSSEKYDVVVDASLNRKTCVGTVKSETIEQLRCRADEALEQLMEDNPDIDFNCWFKTNDQESIGTTTYKLNRSYVKPSCP